MLSAHHDIFGTSLQHTYTLDRERDINHHCLQQHIYCRQALKQARHTFSSAALQVLLLLVKLSQPVCAGSELSQSLPS